MNNVLEKAKIEKFLLERKKLVEAIDNSKDNYGYVPYNPIIFDSVFDIWNELKTVDGKILTGERVEDEVITEPDSLKGIKVPKYRIYADDEFYSDMYFLTGEKEKAANVIPHGLARLTSEEMIPRIDDLNNCKTEQTKDFVICNYCKKIHTREIYNWINIDDPSELVKVNERLFEYTCPYCNKTDKYQYNFIVISLIEKFILYYMASWPFSNGNIRRYDIMQKHMDDFHSEHNDFICRQVGDYFPSLIEHIKLFRDKIDDRIIELAKFSIANNINYNNRESNIYYFDGKFYLLNNRDELMDKNLQYVGELDEKKLKKFGEIIIKKTGKNINDVIGLISQKWAYDFTASFTEEDVKWLREELKS